jgi:DNA-binding MarR family transcriptional regulator
MLDDSRKPTLGDILARAHSSWRRAFARELEARGQALEASGDVLLHLPPDGLAQHTLTDRMGLSKQAVQQLVDRLEARGAVTREPDLIDKRMKRVVPTQAGLSLRDSRREIEDGLDTGLRQRLGKKTYRRLRKSLMKLDLP